MKILLFAYMFLISSFVIGQDKEAKSLFSEVEKEWVLDDNGNVSFTKVVEIPGIGTDELFNRAVSYFTYNYKSGDNVIQMKDKEQRVIIGKGLYGDVYTHVGKFHIISTYDVEHIVRIDVKDQKVRLIITINQYKLKIISAGTTNNSNYNISERFPFKEEVKTHANIMCSTIYNTCQRVKESLIKIEKSLQEGNTNAAENSDW